MDQRSVLGGRAWWFFVLAAAVPAAAAARLGWVVLGGSVDDAFGSQDPPATGATLLGIRWSNLWSNSSLPLLLVVALLPLLVLAAAVRAGGSGAAPSPTARGAAALVAAATSVLGVVGVGGFVAQLTGLLPVVTWSSPTGSKVDGFAPGAAAVLVTAVLGWATTSVLRPRAVDLPDDQEAEDAEPAEFRGDPIGEEPVVLPSAVSERVVTRPEPSESQRLHVLPSVADTDLDLYRRR